MLKKAFSAITSKLPKIIKTVVSKLPQSLQTIANSVNLNSIAESIKKSEFVPQAIKNVAKVVTDDRFLEKLKGIGANSVGSMGASMAASALLGPEAGLVVEGVGLGKDIYDIYQNYKEIDNVINREEAQRKENSIIPKLAVSQPMRNYVDKKEGTFNPNKTKMIYKPVRTGRTTGRFEKRY